MLSYKLRIVFEHILIACHMFILVLVFAESRLMIQDWLHVFGRLHPLLLHFPIVVLLMAVGLLAFPGFLGKDKDNSFYGRNLLLVGCLAAAFTVIAGLLLSAEEGYDRQALQLHKWTGLGVFWFSSLLYLYAEKTTQPIEPTGKRYPVKGPGNIPIRAGAVLVVLTVLASGHFGAAITHGDDFITAPLAKNKEMDVPLEEAVVFAHLVLPILEKKCISCHKASKQKGELRLDQAGFLFTGGESGPAVTAGDVDNSLLLIRIHLDPEDEEHMPPKGKPQLSIAEKELLLEWVRAGADTEIKLLAVEQSSSIYTLGAAKFEKTKKSYGFAAADPGKVKSLNSYYRKVQRIGADSPALSTSYFGKSVFDAASIGELKAVETQLVSLNLNNMPLRDGDLDKLQAFINLEKLFLNATGITGEGLKSLAGLANLDVLSLADNPLDIKNLDNLGALKQLKKLFVWNSGLGMEDIDKLQELLPDTYIDTGHKDDGTVYKLNPPVISFDKAFFRDRVTVKLEHPIQGTSLLYTLDGTDPDSSNHILYQSPLEISENMEVRVRAFASGWLGSETSQMQLIRSGISPKESELMFPTLSRYKGDGVNSLFDREKAIQDVWNPHWLGFRDHPLAVDMIFDNPTAITNMSLSIWYDSGSRFFPPGEIEIWTASGAEEWKLAKTHRPAQPSKDQKNGLLQLPIPFSARAIERMRFIARPMDKLPAWHNGAGSKATIMVDELVMN